MLNSWGYEGSNQEADIDGRRQECLFLIRGRHVEKVNLDIRMSRVECFDNAGQRAVDSEIHVRDAQAADLALGCTLGHSNGGVEMTKRRDAFGVEGAPSISKLNAARGTGEQLGADGFLERLDRSANDRLGRVQSFRCRAEVQLSRDG